MFGHRLREETYLGILEVYHAAELFEITDGNREQLREWLPWVDAVTCVDHSREFIRQGLVQFGKGLGFHAGIWHQKQLSGVIGFHPIDNLNRCVSLGYWLKKSAQGKGLATRACRAMVEHAFRDLGLRRIEIRCAVENRRSRAVPERLGFRHEKTLRGAENLYGEFVDHAVYAMLAQDWLLSGRRQSHSC